MQAESGDVRGSRAGDGFPIAIVDPGPGDTDPLPGVRARSDSEVARRLESAHRPVDLLAFIDTPPRVTGLLDNPDLRWKNFMVAIGLDVKKIEVEHPEILGVTNQDNCAVLLPFLKRRYSAELLESIYRTFRRNWDAGRVYTYQPHHGPVVLYNALNGSLGKRTAFDQYWQAKETIDLEADHHSIVAGSAIRQIANHLNGFSWR